MSSELGLDEGERRAAANRTPGEEGAESAEGGATMLGSLERLARTGSAYLAGSVIQKAASFALLPIYVRHLTQADLGAVEVLLQSVIGVGFVLRFGILEALLRFFHQAGGEGEAERIRRQWAIVRSAGTFLLVSATLGSLVVALAAAPLSRFLLHHLDRELLWISAYGLWIQCIGEGTLTLLRLEERARLYLAISVLNVAVTVLVTVWLLVGERLRAEGFLIGNFAGNTVMVAVILSLYAPRALRVRGPSRLREMLAFGVPAMPAEVSVYLLTVFDRVALVRLVGLAEAGIYAVAVKVSQLVLVLIQAFYQAWPPLAYSIRDDQEAAALYARVITYVAAAFAWLTLLAGLSAPWIVALLAGPSYARSALVVPYLTLGSSLYCVYLTFMVILGRVGRTRINFPLTAVGTAVNVALNLALIPTLGAVGAGVALLASYTVMLPPIFLAVRRLFPLPIEWRRLLHVAAVGGTLYALGSLTSTAGAGALLIRLGAVVLYGLVLAATGFLNASERRAVGRLGRAALRQRAPRA